MVVRSLVRVEGFALAALLGWPVPLPAHATDDTPPEQQANMASSTRPMTDQQLDAVLAEIKQRWEHIRSMRIQYVQAKYLTVFTERIETRSVCLFQPPDRVRFEMVSPYRSCTIVNGESVVKFERDGGSWRKLKPANSDALRGVIQQIAAWLRGDFDATRKIWRVQAAAGDHVAVTLLPRDDAVRETIDRVELRLEDEPWRVVRVTVREPNGDYTTLDFAREQPDPELPSGAFDLDGDRLGTLEWNEDPQADAS
jgi:outer membrane lipoprotein-sorting protein